MAPKPRTPASMRLRSAVRSAVRDARGGLLLVALSGGADSLALAAAVAAEAPRAGARAGAVIVDHGLQAASAEVAERAAAQARGLGLDPVVVRRVRVERGSASATGGLEAAARTARYAAIADAAVETGARWVLTAHTGDDQAEQVLLGLLRGSGTRSLSGMPAERELAHGVLLRRPLLAEQAGVTRETTEASCAELGLEPWRDPHNADPAYARVRVRTEVLPLLEQRLGPGIAAALVRTAEAARADADALDRLAEQALPSVLTSGEGEGGSGAGAGADGVSEGERRIGEPVEASAEAIAALPEALRGRVIRLIAARLGSRLDREHTLAVAALATDWRGQGPVHAPGARVTRIAGRLRFESFEGSPRSSPRSH